MITHITSERARVDCRNIGRSHVGCSRVGCGLDIYTYMYTFFFFANDPTYPSNGKSTGNRRSVFDKNNYNYTCARRPTRGYFYFIFSIPTTTIGLCNRCARCVSDEIRRLRKFHPRLVRTMTFGHVISTDV